MEEGEGKCDGESYAYPRPVGWTLRDCDSKPWSPPESSGRLIVSDLHSEVKMDSREGGHDVQGADSLSSSPAMMAFNNSSLSFGCNSVGFANPSAPSYPDVDH